MRAVRYHDHGGPEVLQVDEVPQPSADVDELLVRVRAASVNPVDALHRSGVLGGGDGAFDDAGLPSVTGTDFAGEVVAVGESVTAFERGDRVFGTGLADASMATVAEYVPVPVDHAAHLPEGIDFEQGAGVAHVGGTAWRAVLTFGEASLDETVLIHGASGGVGHVGVQLAAASGARVIGTARTERARETVRELGADSVLDYRREDLAAAIRGVAEDGVDLILDAHTGDYLPLDVDVAAVGGQVVHLNGAFPPIEHPAATRTKELTIQGVAMHNTDDVGAAMERLARLLETEDLSVVVDRTYGLEETAAAQRALEEDHVVGKIVITI